jgi:CRISPR system Cascade subunit CasA
MVLLEELPSGDVTLMRFIAGQGFESSSNNPDPMQPYEIKKDKGKLPVRFREDRGAWRDFDSLLPDNAGLAPLTTQNALRLAGSKGGKIPESVLVLGLKYEPPNANVDFWRMERFVLPGALADNKRFGSSIRDFLDVAEAVGQSLRSSVWTYQRNTLIRDERKLRKEEKKLLGKMVDAAGPLSQYWSTMESRFHDILHEYTVEYDSEDIRCLWLQSVRDALRVAWWSYSSSISMGDAWAIRALVKAEGPVLRKVKELCDEIAKLAPQKEVA